LAHIPEGVVSTPVLALGAVVSVGLLAVALRRLEDDQVPRTAVLAAAFFVASLISIPLGPSSVHLLLNGLMGLLLGWMAVPALFVAVVLQAVLFGYGGIVVIGVNTMNLALPALICAAALRPLLPQASPSRVFAVGAVAGFAGVMLTGLLVALSLVLSGKPFLPAAKAIVLIALPLALVEGLITGVILRFLQRVAPELLTKAEVADASVHPG
jgi:cobalt/nickel transport system permease protein